MANSASHEVAANESACTAGSESDPVSAPVFGDELELLADFRLGEVGQNVIV